MDGIIVLIILAIVVGLSLRSMFSSAGEPEYIVVAVHPTERRLGCLPTLAFILVAVFAIALVVAER